MFGIKKRSYKNAYESSCENTFVQTVNSDKYSCHPFGYIHDYSPLSVCEKHLYKSLREAVPIIDAAIYKIIRLIGSFRVVCGDSEIQKNLDFFSKNIRVNGTSFGVESFIFEYLEQLLTYGTAVGEIVLDSEGNFAGLYNSSLDDVELIAGENPFDVKIFTVGAYGDRKPVSYPELVLCSAIMSEPGKIYGTSILKGLPFVSDILLKIFNAVGTNWERVGNVRFAVTYKPTEADRSFTKERAVHIANEWGKAMRSREPKDFVAVGDVSIKAIGADNQIPDSQIPVRMILEQIVSKLSIPPFLLGLSWSTTERMSSQQADILTSELEYYRRVLDITLRRIFGTYLQFNGLKSDFEIVWSNINLQDEVELAKARLYNAQAEEIEIKNKKG